MLSFSNRIRETDIPLGIHANRLPSAVVFWKSFAMCAIEIGLDGSDDAMTFLLHRYPHLQKDTRFKDEFPGCFNYWLMNNLTQQ